MSVVTTLDEVVGRLRKQVDWRSPVSGRPQGTVTLPREHALALLAYVDTIRAREE
jgi:hypothetical protein